MDGSLYGTTVWGGQHGYGTVFRLSPSGALTVLHSFYISDGSVPQAALIVGADNALYGTTAVGGDNDFGVIFRITTAGSFSVLHSFNGADGEGPNAPSSSIQPIAACTE